MTWEIVTGLIVLVGFIISIGTIVYKLSRILTKLESAVDGLRYALTKFSENNASEHTRIFEFIESHEKRLTILETKFADAMTPPQA